MKTRLTDADKWDDKWFRGLTPYSKLTFNFLCDKCDNAGFYEVDLEDYKFRTGIEAAQLEKSLREFNTTSKKIIRRGDVIWIKNFIIIQKNYPLRQNNGAHKQIIRILQSQVEIFPECKHYLGDFSDVDEKNVEMDEEVRKIWIRTWGRYPSYPEYELYMNAIHNVFGAEKAYEIMKKSNLKGFRILDTLVNKLDSRGSIRARDEGSNVMTWTELNAATAKMSPAERQSFMEQYELEDGLYRRK